MAQKQHKLSDLIQTNYREALTLARQQRATQKAGSTEAIQLSLLEAEAHFLSGSPRQALTILQTPIDPKFEQADLFTRQQLLACRVLTELGEFEQASLCLEKIVKVRAECAKRALVFAQARLHLVTGQLEDARSLLALSERSSSIAENAELELLLGLSLRDWKLADAVNHLETSVALSTSNALVQTEALLALADCHLRLDNIDAAQQVASTLEACPVPELRDSDVLRLRAKLAVASGENTAGVNTYQLAIAQAEAHERFEFARVLYLELANILEEAGQHVEALDAMKTAQHMSERQVAQSIRTREILSQNSHSVEQLRQAFNAEKQAHDELKSAHARLNAVLGLARGLTGTLDTQTLLRHSYQAISPYMAADAFFIALHNEAQAQLDILFAMDFGQLLPEQAVPLSKRDSYAVDCFTNQQTIIEDDAIGQGKESFFGTNTIGLPRSMLFVPLINREECLGVISIQSADANAYLTEDVELVEALAGFIAAALANALRHESIQQLNRALEAEKTALDRAHQRIEHLALHDQLTGLPNRRLLQRQVDQMIDDNLLFSIGYIDLNDFKPINDQFGHEAGDLLLNVLAARMRQVAKEKDLLVARIGGDEFILLAPKCSAEQTKLLLSGLLDRISQPIELPQSVVSVSACVGVAEFGNHGKSLQRLMSAADQALYQAKNSDDRVIIATAQG
ncbi:diguanylate cyclase domain-containing protein [Salinibius halmophilus]|uniref:diguanylate cyclase domain-containing protein n=1 Tax=Salinibius halmophilus TaxID=1853216 RepID=UPI000E676700|nr:diguanylate cyclase [Salinibius halmophilus]